MAPRFLRNARPPRSPRGQRAEGKYCTVHGRMEYNCSSYRGHDKLLKGFHVEELLQQRQECEQHYQGPAKANPAAVRAPHRAQRNAARLLSN